jgi:hypothetical protein
MLMFKDRNVALFAYSPKGDRRTDYEALATSMTKAPRPAAGTIGMHPGRSRGNGDRLPTIDVYREVNLPLYRGGADARRYRQNEFTRPPLPPLAKGGSHGGMGRAVSWSAHAELYWGTSETPVTLATLIALEPMPIINVPFCMKTWSATPET